MSSIHRKRLSNSQNKYIAWTQQWKCNICKKSLPFSYEIDHIIPLWKNGNNKLNNLQALCGCCHNNKSIIESFQRNKKKKLFNKYSEICFQCNCVYSRFFRHKC